MTLDQSLMPSAHSLLVVGVLLVLTLVARGALKRTPVPPIVVYLAAGLGLNWANTSIAILDNTTIHGLGLLAEAGLVLLLFKVGLESDLRGLIRQIPNAFWIWFCNVAISGALGFCAALYLLDCSLIASLFVGVAMTATSVGVTVAIWQDAGKLKSENGNLLLDVAELDDISSIVLMAVIVALAPVIANGNGIDPAVITATLAKVMSVLVVFIIGCWLFSLYVEKRLTRFVEQRRTDHEPMVMILAAGFIIAALAEVAGLSLAIGAFFAGLAFSRDPETAKEHIVFEGLYAFFTPFFFISLGLLIDLSAFETALWPGLVLLGVAVIGKVAGAGLPAIPRLGGYGALLVGLSMVPRAEIAMVVMQKGLQVGADPRAFAAMMVVSAGTILITAVTLPALMRRGTKTGT